MSTSRNSDWPAVFFLLLLGGALLTIHTFISESTAPGLREGCRATSKLEYDAAEREYVLISKNGTYWCHV